MMFMHDAPPAVNFTQTHGQPKFERFTFAAHIDVNAPPYCRSESNILATSDLHIVKSKGYGFFRRREKLLPGRHVLMQTARLERGRYIKHQNAWVMVNTNARSVFFPHRFSPLLDKLANLQFIVRRRWL